MPPEKQPSFPPGMTSSQGLSFTGSPESFIKNLGTLLSTVGTCSDATTYTMSFVEDPNTKLITVQAFHNPEMKLPRTSRLACGGCGGVMDEEANKNKCYFASVCVRWLVLTF